MKTHLVFGSITVLLLLIVIGARRTETFGFDRVVEMAETMARGKYLSAAPVLPKELRQLSYDQMRNIRWRDELTLWRKEGLPFQARFFHPGGDLLDRSVEIFVLPDNPHKPLRYSPEFFDFGNNVFKEPLPDSVGYAGFRVHYPLNKPDVLDEVFVFLGASYFRAVSKDLKYGPSARGLALDTAMEKKKEEFPVFTKFWLQRPGRSAKQFTMYALLESRSVVGAYRFDVEPGVETRMHVRAVLYFREKVAQAGYAPLTSMFWFGENTSNTFGDFRPEVHDSDGLLLQRGTGEWIWHPLSWSPHMQINVFDDDHPKGFGLLQRDRDFNHYQDLEAHYHERPGIWVQPLFGFDKGSVRLIQYRTDTETWDNVVAFWTPAEPPPLLQPVRLEYILRWYGEAEDLPPLARCVSTRVDRQEEQDRRLFFLDFTGGPWDRMKAIDPANLDHLDVSSPTGAEISEKKIEWNGYNQSWRASFMATTAKSKKPVELICRLVAGGQPVSETWTYTWMP